MRVTKGIVQITNPFIVEFLNTHASNEVILKACDDVLEQFCRMTKECVDVHSKNEKSKKETSGIITFMQEFEKRYLENNAHLEEHLGKMSEGIMDKVSANIMNLIVSIDKTISGSLNQTIKTWLDESLKDNNKDINLSIANLKANLEEVLVSNIKPLHSVVEANNLDRVIGSVKEIETKVNNIITQNVEKWQETKEFNKLHNEHLLDQINQIPNLSKGIFADIIHSLSEKTGALDSMINNTTQQLGRLQYDIQKNSSQVSILTNINTDIKSKIEVLDNKLLSKNIKESQNSKVKGTKCENKMHDLLTDYLLFRDGYEVINVSDTGHSADFLIKREKYPNIRLECKDYDDRVPTSQVQKFVRDVQERNEYGLFVSVSSPITSFKSFEVQQLSTGKVAIYLANNNYDINTILEMINLIYRIDNMICKYNGEHKEEYLQISKENITRIQNAIMDYNDKIKMLKDSMNNSIRIINSLSFDVIEKLLLNEKTNDKQSFICEFCKKPFEKKSGLGGHIKHCPKRNAIPEGIFEEDVKDEMAFPEGDNEIVSDLVPSDEREVEKVDKKQKKKKTKSEDVVKKIEVIEEVVPVKEEVIPEHNPEDDENIKVPEVKEVKEPLPARFIKVKRNKKKSESSDDKDSESS